MAKSIALNMSLQPKQSASKSGERWLKLEEWRNTALAEVTVLQDTSFLDVASQVVNFCDGYAPQGRNILQPSDFVIRRAGLNSGANEDQVAARIVYPRTISEVQNAVSVAVEIQETHGGQVCVRGSGSGFAGLSWGCENGTILDMSEFRLFGESEDQDIKFSESHMQVTVGASTTQGALQESLASRNRALPLGAAGYLSVIGFTIGGGFSELARTYGLACDWVASADLVLANGTLVTANRGDDLLWHLRGGGGGIGVITSMTFNLLPTSPRLVMFSGTWPSTMATGIFRWWEDRELNSTMPDLVKSVGMRLVFSSANPGLVEMQGFHVIRYNEKDDQSLVFVNEFLNPIAGSALGVELKVLTWDEYNYQKQVEKRNTGNLCKFWGRHRSHFMSYFTERNVVAVLESIDKLSPLTDETAHRRVIINAWGGKIAEESTSDMTSFWGRDASFEIKLEIEYDATVTWNHLPRTPPWRDLRLAFHWARWAEGWIEHTSARLCYHSNGMCRFGFANHESEVVHAPRLFGPHLLRLRLIKGKNDPLSLFVAKTDYDDTFAGPALVEQVATLDEIMGIDKISETRNTMKRTPIVGYSPLYFDLPKKSDLERFDVLAIFAATTLVRDESDASSFSCNAACDVGFADASYEAFQSHAKMAKKYVKGAVLLTFGGAAMNPCWELCMSAENIQHVAVQLAGLVAGAHLDGIDFNIEIPPEPTSLKFVKNLVTATHSALLTKSNKKKWVLSHATIAHQLDHGGIWSRELYKTHDYLHLFMTLHKAGFLSFVFIQYYNTFPAAIINNNALGVEALVGQAFHLRRSLPAEKLILGVCSGHGCGEYNVEGSEASVIWHQIQSLSQNAFYGLGLWWASRETSSEFLDQFDAALETMPTQDESSVVIMIYLLIIGGVLLLLLVASILTADKTITEVAYSMQDQNDVISSPLPGFIPVFIPVYKESVLEIRKTMANFKECNVANVYVRSALRIYFIVDNTRASEVVQTLLEVCVLDGLELEDEFQTPVLCGTCYGVKCKIVLKGETQAWPQGKRHSSVLFTKIVKNDELSGDINPWAALCLDSDVLAYPRSIERLVIDLMLDPNCAVTCGNMLPSAVKESSLCFHLQRAEYHVQNRVVKNAEALVGVVSCCPGAFMCIRFPVFDNALNSYVGLKLDADACFSRNCIDLGEDRYLTSILLTKLGEKTSFCSSAICTTEVPQKFLTLLKQRRRWFNSAFFNDLFLLVKIVQVTWTSATCNSMDDSTQDHSISKANLSQDNNGIEEVTEQRSSFYRQHSKTQRGQSTTVRQSSSANLNQSKENNVASCLRLLYIFVFAFLRAISSVLSPGFSILLMFQISLFAQKQSLIDYQVIRLVVASVILCWAFFIFLTFTIIGKNKNSWFAKNEKAWVNTQIWITVTLMHPGFAAVLTFSDKQTFILIFVGIITILVVYVAAIVQISDYRSGSAMSLCVSLVPYLMFGLPFFAFIQPLYAFAQIDNLSWGTRGIDGGNISEENNRIKKSLLFQKKFCWVCALCVNVIFFSMYSFLPSEWINKVLAGFTAAVLVFYLFSGFWRSFLLQRKSCSPIKNLQKLETGHGIVGTIGEEESKISKASKAKSTIKQTNSSQSL